MDLRDAGAVICIEESFGLQNPWVPIVLETLKSADAKGDVPKIYGFVHPLHLCANGIPWSFYCFCISDGKSKTFLVKETGPE